MLLQTDDILANSGSSSPSKSREQRREVGTSGCHGEAEVEKLDEVAGLWAGKEESDVESVIVVENRRCGEAGGAWRECVEYLEEYLFVISSDEVAAEYRGALYR